MNVTTGGSCVELAFVAGDRLNTFKNIKNVGDRMYLECACSLFLFHKERIWLRHATSHPIFIVNLVKSYVKAWALGWCKCVSLCFHFSNCQFLTCLPVEKALEARTRTDSESTNYFSFFYDLMLGFMNFQSTDNGRNGFLAASTKTGVKFLPHSSSLVSQPLKNLSKVPFEKPVGFDVSCTVLTNL